MPHTDTGALNFPMVTLGRLETAWDLRCLLYHGGAATRSQDLATQIAEGRLGAPLPERRELVERIHLELVSMLVGGRSKSTVKSIIYCLRSFFGWIDDVALVISVQTAGTMFMRWTDYLLHRQYVVCDLRERGVYQLAKTVASVLDHVLERRISVLADTRIRRPREHSRGGGTRTGDLDFEKSFVFGHALLDICDAMTV
jgi:hypothetical protein